MPPLTEPQIQDIVRRITAFYAEPAAEVLIANIGGAPNVVAQGIAADAESLEKFTKTFEYLTYVFFQENPMDLDRANTTVNAIRAGLTDPDVNADDQFTNFITR